MAKISPFLWFVGNMQEAVDFYVKVFKGARVIETNPVEERNRRPRSGVCRLGGDSR